MTDLTSLGAMAGMFAGFFGGKAGSRSAAALKPAPATRPAGATAIASPKGSTGNRQVPPGPRALPGGQRPAQNASLVTAHGEERLLTVHGERYELPQDQQEMFALTSDGVLLVSEAHKNSPHFFSLRERLQRNKFEYTLKVVSHSEVGLVYSKLGKARKNSAVDATARQNEVIQLLKASALRDASDLHLRVEAGTTQLYIRVDGELERQPDIGAEHGMTLISTIYNSMCDVAQSMFLPNQPQDARLAASHTRTIGLKGCRLATRPTDGGLLAVLRLFTARRRGQSLRELGFLPEQEAMIHRMSVNHNGINILSGPTGSGKSTTLETFLNELMAKTQGKYHLITLEDPPEYEIAGAVQTPVQYPSNATEEEKSESWARAISNLMRLDPDMMMIGEIRDYATAMASFRGAMTGHGIWTTLHANDVVNILFRLKDMGVDMSLVTDPQILTGMISQRLTPRVCPACKVSYRDGAAGLAADLRARIEKHCHPEKVWLKGSGLDADGRTCPVCRGRGVSGRIVIPEVVLPTKGFMDVFKSGGQLDARNYWVERMQGITRNEIIVRRINEGLIDPHKAEESVCALDDDERTLGRGGK